MITTRYLVLIGRSAAPTSDCVERIATAKGLTPWRSPSAPLAILVDARPRQKTTGAGEGTRSGPGEAGVDAGGPPPGVLPPGLTVRCDQAGVVVARDPSAAAPCCWCATPERIVLASEPALLTHSRSWRPAVDWDGLAAGLYAAGVPAERTALTGCRELLPGFHLTVDRRGRCWTDPWWSPWQAVATDGGGGADALAHDLRRAIEAAVADAAAPYARVLVGVSGGLDSSILAAALIDCGKPVTCFTMATDNVDGDERQYARLLARHLGVDLIEGRYGLADINLGSSVSARLSRPVARTHEQSYYKQVELALAASSSEAFFTGNGGDAVFCSTRSAVALVDQLLSTGPGLGALRTLRDLCRLTGAGPVAVLRMAARKLAPRHWPYRARSDGLFLDPSIRDVLAAQPLQHPWLDAPRHGLPGRAVHIAMVLRIQQALENHRTVPVLHPLAARRVLETAFAIPTWRWIEDGVDRAVARRAYAARLPAALLARRVKGTPDSFAIALIERFRPQIAERLLDGRLAAHRLICRQAVGEGLRRFGPGQPNHHVRLLQLLEAENWAAHWETVDRSLC